MRLAKKSEPQLSLITQVHPNEGETAVTNEEEAHRYGQIAAREGLNSYPPGKRMKEAAYCTSCGAALWAANSAPLCSLLDRPHIMLIQHYVAKPPSPPQISYAAAFYCKESAACAEDTRKRLTAIHVKAMARWMPRPPTGPQPSDGTRQPMSIIQQEVTQDHPTPGPPTPSQ